MLLSLGVALTMTGDAVSEVQARLAAIAAAHGYERARISVFPTLLIIAVDEEHPAGLRTIDSTRHLRLDQSTEVIRVARAAQATDISPAEARAQLQRAFAMSPRFGTVAYVLSHAVATVGLALVIRPAAVDLWLYVLLGLLVGAMKAWAARFATGGYLIAIVSAAVVSAIAFLAHDGNDAASLRLIIPPLVTFLPGALLTMATVDLAMGETVTGASRFVAGVLQLTLLGVGIVIGAEIVGGPSGPAAGEAARALGAWAPWLGVLVFGLGIAVHESAPKRSVPWLLVVLFSAWIGQIVGRQVVDAELSGFVGAAVMVPIAHAVARVRTAPPAHVMFLPAFWLLVPGTIGLVGITELVGGTHAELGAENFGTALVANGSVALGILTGSLIVRASSIVLRRRARDPISA